MAKSSRSFQVFVKPGGAACNLGCSYCYYLEKLHLFPESGSSRMPDDILEDYIVQHMDASPDPVVRFSWHGGEPTVLGLDYFRTIVEMQRTHKDPARPVVNGIQTNGTLLNEQWCRFLARERFSVGLSLDGPPDMHDTYRRAKDGTPTHARAVRGYRLLRRHGITPDILCVVSSRNVSYPLEVYRYFKQLGARYIGFLPLVEPEPGGPGGVSRATVPADAFGTFLCTVFDEWRSRDIGRIKVQILEEAAATALDRDHELCIFRPGCGEVPVLEHTGDFFTCDHFVDPGHHLGNIRDTSLVEVLEHPDLLAFGRAKSDGLPGYCRACEVLSMCHGECPKNRFIRTPAGEEGLNYLCAGYRRFFNHVRPFVGELAGLWRRQAFEAEPARAGAATQVRAKTGRNDPCPCGSGKKYKKCCLGK